MQKRKEGSNPIEAFCFKEVKADLVRSMSSPPALPSLEISLLDSEGKSVQSELVEPPGHIGIYDTRRNILIPNYFSGLDVYAPWRLITLNVSDEYGGNVGQTMILRETSFHVVMAVEPSALRSAQTINVKLVN